MKKAIILLLLFFSANVFAQKSDTLIVPVGKYNYIKVGDKVYKINTTLEEVKPVETLGISKLWQWQTTPNYQPLPYLVPDSTILIDHGNWNLAPGKNITLMPNYLYNLDPAPLQLNTQQQ